MFISKQAARSAILRECAQLKTADHPMIPISDTPVAGHSLEKVAACRSEKGLQSIALGAKALALTALELIENPALLDRIKADHRAAVAAQEQL